MKLAILLITIIAISFTAARSLDIYPPQAIGFPVYMWGTNATIRDAVAYQFTNVQGSVNIRYNVYQQMGSHPKFQVYLFNQTNFNTWLGGSDSYYCLNEKECTYADDWAKSYIWGASVFNYENFFVVIKNRNWSKDAKVVVELSAVRV
eukprot:TRINITY_DN11903_c0_g1_i1.p1 TRINITY_DN11903_c0_g1~~TRINITY_DN11903_c0_g1_i1.p1  ORF type:complete len:148 (-),score=28.88 TRINITY_DN11903_c0_g1_i1:39-482(-)